MADPKVSTLDLLLRACGDELAAVAQRGIGVDRSLIRRRLTLTPRQRLEKGAADADAIGRARRAQPVRR